MSGTTNLASLARTASLLDPTDLLHLSQSGVDKKLPLSVLYAAIIAAYPVSQAAWSITTAAFTQPAVGANVTIPVVNSQWMTPGQAIYVSGGGNYLVVSKPNSASVLAQNLGSTGAAAVGATVTTGAGVAASGMPGPTGATGSSSLTTVTASFTMPAVGASVTVPVGTSTWMSLDQPVYVGSAGFFTVGAIYSGVSIALTNAGVTGNAAPGTVIATGQNLTAAGAQGAPGTPGPAGGVSGGTLTGPLNAAVPVTLASATLVAIGAASSNIINITGTATIAAFDAIAAGAERELQFAGVLTLLHNPTSLILLGAANITTAAGDVAVFRSLGSGNWTCVSYQRANGGVVATSAGIQKATAGGALSAATAGTDFFSPAINGAAPVTLASAATVAIGAAASDNVTISGTTAITAFDTVAAGIRRFVTFSGILTLTHNATSLILPGAANISTAANDTAVMLSLGSGNWQCIAYQKAAGAGSVGGAWQLYGGSLATAQKVASNSASLDWTGLSGYSKYAIVFENIEPSSVGFQICIRLGTGSTPTWITSGYQVQGIQSSGTTVSALNPSSPAQWVIASMGYLGSAGLKVSGIAYLGAMQTSNPTLISEAIGYLSSGIERDVLAGAAPVGVTPTALRIFVSSGNISSGTATLYGIN